MRRALHWIEELIAGTALVIVVLAVVWGVITRYITAQPAAWAAEVAGIAFAWCVFVGAAAGVKRGTHVSIDMLVMLFPAPVQRAVNRLAAFVALGFCAAATVMAASFAADNFDNPSAVLRLPLSVLYGALVVGFALMTWRSAQAMLGQRWEDPWAA